MRRLIGVSVRSTDRVVLWRDLGLVGSLFTAIVAVWHWSTYFAEGGDYRFIRLMVGASIVSVIYPPYGLFCMLLERSRLPRLLVVNPGEKGPHEGIVLVTWRSLFDRSLIQVRSGLPLGLDVRTRDRFGASPGQKVDIAISDTRSSVALRIVTEDPPGAVEELIQGLAKHGIAIERRSWKSSL